MLSIIFDSLLCNTKSIRKERYRLVQLKKRQAHSSYDRTLRCSGSIDRDWVFNGSCEFWALIHKRRGSEEWSLHGFADLTYRMGKTPIFDAQFWRKFVGSRWSVETFCKCYPEGSYIVLTDRELFVDERLRGPVKLYAKKMVGRTREKRYLSASEGGRRHATTIFMKERKLMRK